ncbi:Protein of unknown function [Pyronema omphalodes CBS 100304]|uniref:Uncharacterized protein n=1 Tax=Pyronema omphalodes (strain CBS 100304) TaxID=1076935 RepID=U4KVF4_PYROM|nr:Protein of unknown function [Pyronema omphalodes CBS 100304]
MAPQLVKPPWTEQQLQEMRSNTYEEFIGLLGRDRMPRSEAEMIWSILCVREGVEHLTQVQHEELSRMAMAILKPPKKK